LIGRVYKERSTMKTKMILTVSFILVSLIWTQQSTSADKQLIKISQSFLPVDNNDLDSVSFTVQNLMNRPLEWIKIRAIFKNRAGEVMQTETFEKDLTKKPLEPRGARQMTHYVSNNRGINIFRTGVQSGQVDIRILDFRLVNVEDGKKVR
jgi:hypothetical protein